MTPALRKKRGGFRIRWAVALARTWGLYFARGSANTRLGSPAHALNSGFTCEHAHYARHGRAENADHFATSSPFSRFFAEAVCGLGATPLQTATPPPPNGGNCTTRGSDTPATRRQKASCSAKPPSATGLENASGTESLAAVLVGAKKFAQHGPSGGSSAKKFAQHAQKRRIWANLSARGEYFRACRRRPSSALPISDLAPLVWRVLEGPEGPAAVPADNGARPRYPQTTGAPSPSKFRMQFPHDTDRHTLKNRRISTIRFQ